MPFQKGQSGNPGGRTKSKHVVETLKIIVEKHPDTFARRIMQLLESNDERVKLQTIDMVMDRLYGKPTQSTNLNVGIDEATARRLIDIAERIGNK